MTVLLALLLFQSNVDRAQSLLRQGKVDEAQQVIQEALKAEPDSVPALLLQGRLAMAKSDFDSARAAFTKASQLAPSSADAEFLLGFFHYVDNDFAQAAPALERARKLAPDHPRTLLFLALTYDGLARPELAEDFFKETFRAEAKAQRPTVEAHVGYARMLFAAGRFGEAQAQITTALRLDSRSREALYEQARLRFERALYGECIAAAERALELNGDGVTPRQIHFLLSRAYDRLGNKDRAAAHRKQFEAIPPRLIR